MYTDLKFSIIIPVYNSQDYIEDCIISIFKQNYKNFEIIAIDDGSSDSSLTILNQLKKRDDRLFVYHKENGGSVSARKLGCNKASGEYIIVIDSDDFVSERYLESIYKELKENGFPDMIAMGYQRVDEEGRRIGRPILNGLQSKMYAGKDMIYVRDNFLFSKVMKNTNSGCLLFSLCTKVIKKHIYVTNQNAEPDNIKYGEDLILTSLILNDTSSIFVSQIVGYNYRTSKTSMMLHLASDSLQDYEITINYLKQIYQNDLNKVSVFSEDALYRFFSLHARQASNYREFKSVFVKSYKNKELWTMASKSRYKKDFKGFIKHILIKYKLVFLFYLVNKL